MELLVQRLFDSGTNGAIYAALALALVLIHRSTGLLNFAQGEMAMFSTYLALVLASDPSPALAGTTATSNWLGTPWPVPFAIAGSVVASMVLGALIERTVIRPATRGDSIIPAVSITLGLFLTINALAGEIWGLRFRPFPSPFPTENDDYLELAGARLRFEALGIWLTLLVVIGALFLFLRSTRLGLAFRAVSVNRESAELHGIDGGRTIMLGWAMAAGLGAVAGCLVANNVLVEPDMMQRLLVFSFAAATLGGLDNLAGAIVGGVLLALAQTMLAGYVDPIGAEHNVLIALGVVVLVLLVRPTGVLGRRPVDRV